MYGMREIVWMKRLNLKMMLVSMAFQESLIRLYIEKIPARRRLFSYSLCKGIFFPCISLCILLQLEIGISKLIRKTELENEFKIQNTFK